MYRAIPVRLDLAGAPPAFAYLPFAEKLSIGVRSSWYLAIGEMDDTGLADAPAAAGGGDPDIMLLRGSQQGRAGLMHDFPCTRIEPYMDGLDW